MPWPAFPPPLRSCVPISPSTVCQRSLRAAPVQACAMPYEVWSGWSHPIGRPSLQNHLDTPCGFLVDASVLALRRLNNALASLVLPSGARPGPRQLCASTCYLPHIMQACARGFSEFERRLRVSRVFRVFGSTALWCEAALRIFRDDSLHFVPMPRNRNQQI